MEDFDIKKLGARIDIHSAQKLIAYSLGKAKPVASKTVYEWVKRGYFPKKLDTPYGAAVWNTKECLKTLKLD